MTSLQEARVARLAECHRQQKAGYNQHTTPILPNTTPILNVIAKMENNGKRKDTVKFTFKALTFLSKHTALTEPEAVKALIAHLLNKEGEEVSNGYKRNLCIAYNKFCQYYKIQWEMPLYKVEEREIELPTKERIDMLIANASTILSLKLSVSKDAGLRPCELMRLKIKNFNHETKQVFPTTAKNGSGRAPKITENTATRLYEHILRNGLKQEDKIFKGDAEHYGDDFREMRNKLAIKLNDPKIHEIRLYDIRHYYCSHTLRKTGNAYVTMKLMGHKKLTTTQKYMHLIENTDGEWIVEQTNDKKRAQELLESDFTYQLTTPDGYMLFRKAK